MQDAATSPQPRPAEVDQATAGWEITSAAGAQAIGQSGPDEATWVHRIYDCFEDVRHSGRGVGSSGGDDGGPAEFPRLVRGLVAAFRGGPLAGDPHVARRRRACGGAAVVSRNAGCRGGTAGRSAGRNRLRHGDRQPGHHHGMRRAVHPARAGQSRRTRPLGHRAAGPVDQLRQRKRANGCCRRRSRKCAGRHHRAAGLLADAVRPAGNLRTVLRVASPPRAPRHGPARTAPAARARSADRTRVQARRSARGHGRPGPACTSGSGWGAA